MSKEITNKRFKILIVDDSRDSRQFLKLIISNKFDCDVVEAQNGQEALKLVFDDEPGLILLDVMMPIMDGYEFLKILRADDRGNNIPVIVCSAVGERSTVASLVEEGITDYILKPINLPLVYSKINRIIKKSLTKYMEFSLNQEGTGAFVSEPYPKEVFIKLKSVEGAIEDDVYILRIGDEEPKSPAKISDNSIIKIPAHDQPLKLSFRFSFTKNRVVTIFYDMLD